jgi:hypothetical protein
MLAVNAVPVAPAKLADAVCSAMLLPQATSKLEARLSNRIFKLDIMSSEARECHLEISSTSLKYKNYSVISHKY